MTDHAGGGAVADEERRRERALRRRGAIRSMLGAMVLGLAITVAYFVLPFTSPLTGATLLWLVLGLVAIGVLIVWQVRAVARSPYPRARAVGGLIVSLPLFLALFSTTYFFMGRAQPSDWSEPLSRLDAAYFTVTVFATVGFGDIVPVTAVARAVTTVQMLGDILLVGLVARVLVVAMQEGLRRTTPPGEEPPGTGRERI